MDNTLRIKTSTEGKSAMFGNGSNDASDSNAIPPTPPPMFPPDASIKEVEAYNKGFGDGWHRRNTDDYQPSSMSLANARQDGYLLANKDFLKACKNYDLSPAATDLHTLIVAAQDAARNTYMKLEDERRYEHGDDAYKKGLADGKAEAELEATHRQNGAEAKATTAIDHRGMRVTHCGALTLIINHYAKPEPYA